MFDDLYPNFKFPNESLSSFRSRYLRIIPFANPYVDQRPWMIDQLGRQLAWNRGLQELYNKYSLGDETFGEFEERVNFLAGQMNGPLEYRLERLNIILNDILSEYKETFEI